MLAQEYGIDGRRVLAFDNNGSFEEAIKKIAPLIDSIIDPGTSQEEAEGILADNSPIVTPEEPLESNQSTPEVTADNRDYQLEAC